MATRTLLCVEPDEAALETLTSALAPYGFEIKNIVNGDEAVEWGRKNPPAIIIVSVEPKKVGYAICNKLKRSPELKSIPLILTSAEEPAAKFEQHKTFKLRADEYLFKPFNVEELLQKVDQLVGLGAPNTNTDEVFLSADLLSSEIAIEADDIVEETTPPPEAPGPTAKGAVLEMEAETSDSAALGASLDAIFDKEAQAAFDALEMKETPTVTGSTLSDTAQEASGDSSWDEQKATIVSPSALIADLLAPSAAERRPGGEADMRPMPGMVPANPPAAPPLPSEAQVEKNAAEISTAPHPAPTDDAAAPPEPDMVNHAAMEAIAAPSPPEGLLAELQERIHQLENENRRLQAEIEDLNNRLQAQPFHKERDLLGLRETINRKEKDLLDLRDALDAKERQMLDQRDRIREHERARRDLEEKMLAMEKTLVYANERVTALSQDKERAVERERALKVRLDDSLLELAKTQDELEALRKRLATAEDRARVEVEKIRLDMENHVSDLEQVHRAEIAQLNNERQAAEAAREEQVRAEKAEMEAEHAAEIEALQRRAADDLAAIEDRHDVELTRLKREHEKAIAALKEEAAAQLAAERQAHEAAAETKERDHKNEIQALRRRLEDELAAAEARRQLPEVVVVQSERRLQSLQGRLRSVVAAVEIPISQVGRLLRR